MFFCEGLGHMEKLRSFGRVLKKWPKKSLTWLLHVPLQMHTYELIVLFSVYVQLSFQCCSRFYDKHRSVGTTWLSVQQLDRQAVGR